MAKKTVKKMEIGTVVNSTVASKNEVKTENKLSVNKTETKRGTKYSVQLAKGKAFTLVGVKFGKTSNDKYYAIVGQSKVYLTSLNGKVAYENVYFFKYDNFDKEHQEDRQHVERVGQHKIDDAIAFLEAKYCLKQRDFSLIEKLVKEGVPLMTKSELAQYKQQQAVEEAKTKALEAPKAVKSTDSDAKANVAKATKATAKKTA